MGGRDYECTTLCRYEYTTEPVLEAMITTLDVSSGRAAQAWRAVIAVTNRPPKEIEVRDFM